MSSSILILVDGFSGSGKSTLIDNIMHKLHHECRLSDTYRFGRNEILVGSNRDLLGKYDSVNSYHTNLLNVTTRIPKHMMTNNTIKIIDRSLINDYAYLVLISERDDNPQFYDSLVESFQLVWSQLLDSYHDIHISTIQLSTRFTTESTENKIRHYYDNLKYWREINGYHHESDDELICRYNTLVKDLTTELHGVIDNYSAKPNTITSSTYTANTIKDIDFIVDKLTKSITTM